MGPALEAHSQRLWCICHDVVKAHQCVSWLPISVRWIPRLFCPPVWRQACKTISRSFLGVPYAWNLTHAKSWVDLVWSCLVQFVFVINDTNKENAPLTFCYSCSWRYNSSYPGDADPQTCCCRAWPLPRPPCTSALGGRQAGAGGRRVRPGYSIA